MLRSIQRVHVDRRKPPCRVHDPEFSIRVMSRFSDMSRFPGMALYYNAWSNTDKIVRYMKLWGFVVLLMFW